MRSPTCFSSGHGQRGEIPKSFNPYRMLGIQHCSEFLASIGQAAIESRNYAKATIGRPNSRVVRPSLGAGLAKCSGRVADRDPRTRAEDVESDDGGRGRRTSAHYPGAARARTEAQCLLHAPSLRAS
jgi:hypothetical protein